MRDLEPKENALFRLKIKIKIYLTGHYRCVIKYSLGIV